MPSADPLRELAEPHVSRTSLRILVADDDPASLALVCRILRESGHEVLTASDGAEALRVVLHDGPNIVITDWNMPVMDGLEFCHAVRHCEACGFVYVLLMTSSQAADALERAFAAGADDILQKPISPGELVARLRAAERVFKLHQDVDKRNREVHRANAEMQLAADRLAGANRKLIELATTDELTGLANRRAGMQRLEDAWSLSVRYGSPMACMLIDIDHFKRVNDTRGHDTGDLVLARVAAGLKKIARKGEIVCRLGGEEFLVVCPHATEEQATTGAERLRHTIETLVIDTPVGPCPVTVSVGVACRVAITRSPEDLLKAADEALYCAKRTGRNRVVSAAALPHQRTGVTTVEPSPTANEGGAPPAAHRSDLQLLYLDDAGDPACLSSRALDAQGFRVMHVRTPAEALVALSAGSPDAIVVHQSSLSRQKDDWSRAIADAASDRSTPIITVDERFEEAALAGAPMTKENAGQAGAEVLAGIVGTLARTQLARESFLRAHEAHGEQARSMALLLDLSAQLIASTTLAEAMEAVGAAASELTCSSRVGVLIPDPDGKSLRIDAATGVEATDLEGLRIPRHVDGVDILTLSEPIEIATADEVLTKGRFLLGTPFAGTPLVALAFACSGRPVGMLCVADRYNQRPLSGSELDFLGLLGNITASAIEGHMSRDARDAARDSIVIALATLAENRDSDTGKHLERVTRYSTLLADELRRCDWSAPVVDEAFVQELARAVPLHDIGKVAIPDSILLKPDRLTDDQKLTMQRHTLLGASTIQSVMERAPGAKFLQFAEQIAHYHHEWFDGGGYPEGLEGETIPLAARIVAVADVYDALTSVRVYKRAMTHARAVEIINQASGIQFDPRIVDAFNRHAHEFERLARELADHGKAPEVDTGESKLDYREIVFQA